MTDEHGVQVDVDLVDGAEAFDAYRVQFFYEEQHGVRLSTPDLEAACSYLAARHELEEVQQGRWYACLSCHES